MKTVDPLERLRALVAQHGTHQATAAALGVSQAYLSDILKGARTVSPRMLALLGLQRIVVEQKRAS